MRDSKNLKKRLPSLGSKYFESDWNELLLLCAEFDDVEILYKDGFAVRFNGETISFETFKKDFKLRKKFIDFVEKRLSKIAD